MEEELNNYEECVQSYMEIQNYNKEKLKKIKVKSNK